MYFFAFAFSLLFYPLRFFLPSSSCLHPFGASGFTRTLYLFIAYGSLMSIFALFYLFFNGRILSRCPENTLDRDFMCFL